MTRARAGGLLVHAAQWRAWSAGWRIRLEEETERERTYSCSYLDADGRGQELALQFSTALFLARAREGTGRPVMPAHVAFAQPAPRSHRWDHPTTQATADRTPV